MRCPRTGMQDGLLERPVDVEPAGRTADSAPSRSTDQNAALRCSGTGSAMWLGTTSTTRPMPCSRRRSAAAQQLGLPAELVVDVPVVDHVVAVRRARRRPAGSATGTRGPRRAREVVGPCGEGGEPALGGQLDAVGRQRAAVMTPSRSTTTLWLVRTTACPLRTPGGPAPARRSHRRVRPCRARRARSGRTAAPAA